MGVDLTMDVVRRSAATTVLELFDAQAATQPDAIALRHRGSSLTYGELDRWSRQVAAGLTEAGASTGDLVAFAVQRSPAMIAAVLGVVRVGVGYLALDAQAPTRWRSSVFEAARPCCLLGGTDLSTMDIPTVPVGEPPAGQVPSPPYRTAPPPDAVFQVAPTSGTTGTPRLVRISYRAMLNRLAWMWRDHPFTPGSVVAIQKSPALVASPWEMLGGLLTGTPSVVLTREEVVDPVLLAETIAAERITHLYLTPHLLAGLLDVAERGTMPAHRMSLVTSGADALQPVLARRFRRAFPDVLLLNLYGMTETSSNIAAFDTSELSDAARRVPVGRPVAGAQISVRDTLDRPVPIGVAGEIWVSGPPLALGYLGDEARTAERFVRQPGGTVRYRTGDRGRWLAGGALEVLGRTDNQIKIRGYRVELEEVEAALAEAPEVTGAGAFVLPADDPVLVGCVTGGDNLDLTTVRAHLHDRLPDYLVPARLLAMPALPMAGNGKVDRGELARLAEHTGPSTPTVSYEPADAREQLVVRCWTELLTVPPRDGKQSFFEAGGHSLLAVRLIGALEQAFGQRVPLRAIFEDSSVSGIVRLLAKES